MVIKMSRSFLHGLLLVAAALALLAIADGLGSTRTELAQQPNVAQPPADAQASAPEAASGDRIPVTKRASSLGFDENSPDPRRLPCMQLQVIDEIDLLGDADCD
jgi:hypothetical protein